MGFPQPENPMGGCLSSPVPTKRQREASFFANGSSTVRPRFAPLRPITILISPNESNIFQYYQLGKELGRGEFGVTHECKEISTGQTFACKSISKSRLRTETDVEDVRREVEIMRHLPEHPNIVKLKEAYEDKESVHLVMELCEGGELFDRILARGHYTERAASAVMKTIMEIVRVCHENGVIHRDLKPENFLFANASETSPLKVIDFGLSIFFEPGQRFGEVVGSPYYMAPELLRRNYGPEVDIWSAGVILYILLCGAPPFWSESEEGIAQAIVHCIIDFDKDPWPKVSAEAKDLVRGMLNPNPYTRLKLVEVLEHPWVQNDDKIPNVLLGESVRARIKQFSLMNKFKKKVLRVVAHNLPAEQVDGIKEMFHIMDTDKNGNLSLEELKDGLHLMGHSVAEPEVQMLMDAADVDGSGTLDCEEFMTVSVHLKRISSEEHLFRAFGFFDKNKTGYIEVDELKDVLLEDNLGSNYEQVVQEIMFDADTDKDGCISFDEFKAMMNAGMEWKMASRQYSRAMLNAISFKLFKDESDSSDFPAL